MQSRFVPLATGLRYHVLEWGADRPHDHTLLLLHGFLDLARGFRPLVEAGLAERFHVVAPDLRGHGDSDRVGAGGYYHFLDYLADVHELVRLVGRARVSLVGHSMGGGVASYYAGTFPSRVHKLALLEGIGPPPQLEAGPGRVAAWLDGWERVRARPQRGYASIDEAAARLREHDPLLPEAFARELAEHGTRPDADGQRRFKHDPLHLTMAPYGFQPELAERFWRAIPCPVLIVDAARSELRLAPELAAARRACFARARRVELADAGHMMQRHQPAALARLLAEFFAD